MTVAFDDLNDFFEHGFDTLIDVRSPGEFAEDHIPGAISLPVLSDKERARVGTIYTQDNAFKAKKIGAALVAKNAAKHLQGPLAEKDGGWRPLVYCWRGGQRSGSFASILSQIGWRADTIAGGYQTYRRMVAQAMHVQPLTHHVLIIDGNTGTAKTDLLHLLADRGLQVLDLEALAAHRGSVFGAMSRGQPSQKSFEGKLAAAFCGFDPARPVLVEAESSKIGRILIPPSLWDAMKAAPRIAVSAPLSQRAQYLTRAYGDIVADADVLADRLKALTQHQGRERVENWQALAADGDMETLAGELMRDHYDPSYARSRAAHSDNIVEHLAMNDLSPVGLAKSADQLAAAIANLDMAKTV